MKHKILSLVIAFAMLFGTVNFAFAAENTTVDDALALLGGLEEVTLEESDAVEAARAAYEALDKFEKAEYGLNNYLILTDAEVAIVKLQLEAMIAEGNYLAEEIAAVQADLEAKMAEYDSAVNALVVFKTSVTGLKISQSKSTIKASWNAVDGAYKYVVKLYKDGKYVSNSTKYVSGTSYSYTNLLRGSTYKVWVKPYAKHKDVAYYGKANYKYTSAKKLVFVKPTLNIAKSGKYRVLKVADQNSTGFQVYVSKDKNFKKNVKKVRYATNKKALNKKVETKKFFNKGTNYIKVRAYSKVNGKYVYGSWSKVKTVKR